MSLRAALLDRAEEVIRERGVEALSLRELARDLGVSHGAPRTHFVDRRALLDALAERGFQHLTGIFERAADRAVSVDALGAAGGEVLTFAVANAGLVDLMFTTKMAEPAASIWKAAEAAQAALRVLVNLVAEASGLRSPSPQQVLLWTATVQGTVSLVTSGRLPSSAGEPLMYQVSHLIFQEDRAPGTG